MWVPASMEGKLLLPWLFLHVYGHYQSWSLRCRGQRAGSQGNAKQRDGKACSGKDCDDGGGESGNWRGLSNGRKKRNQGGPEAGGGGLSIQINNRSCAQKVRERRTDTGGGKASKPEPKRMQRRIGNPRLGLLFTAGYHGSSR